MLDKRLEHNGQPYHVHLCVPLRLLDCLGLDTAAFSTARAVAGIPFFFLTGHLFRSVTESFVLEAGGEGSGEARKKTDGDGIVIVSAIDGTNR